MRDGFRQGFEGGLKDQKHIYMAGQISVEIPGLGLIENQYTRSLAAALVSGQSQCVTTARVK